MKPLRTRLMESRTKLGLGWEVIERDYLLSWILAGIAQVESLRHTLVFKGGTALKKCYFGEYRLSEDLDFSGLPGVPTGTDMEQAISQVCDGTQSLLDEYAPVEISFDRYTEKNPHPGKQEAFNIRARLPWQRRPQTVVMIEISMDEPVLKPKQIRKIIHEYGEAFDAEIAVYALEEIVAEKLRAILQHIEKLKVRGWSRSRARDYYDLWRVLGTYRDEMDLKNFTSFLHQKCATRHVSFSSPGDFFQSAMLASVEKSWEQWLEPLVPDLPSFETVVPELREQVSCLLNESQ